jgi:rod shape-determining protein MreB
LGTANTLVYVSGKGIVLEEPLVVSDRIKIGNPVAVGEEAKKCSVALQVMSPRLRPLRDGVIADFYSCEIMLAEFIKRALDGTIGNPRMVIGVPSGITGVERCAVVDAAEKCRLARSGVN